jgi:membrane protease YdiL (CAAX protease family)
METVLPTPAEAASVRRIAHPFHTIILLAGEGMLVVRSAMHAEQMRTAVNLNRVHMYERTMLTEWLGLGFVLLGVWLARADFSTVLGERWRSARAVLRDIGLGVAFSIVSTMVLSMLQPHEGGGGDRAVQFLLPQGSFEMTLWVALSITAGICEEAIYRGYLQRQFIALTKNVPAGIVISGVAFGLAHSYQGWRLAIVIGLEGVMLGVMAHWRKSVRPGMVAHAFKDALAPMLMSMMRH